MYSWSSTDKVRQSAYTVMEVIVDLIFAAVMCGSTTLSAAAMNSVAYAVYRESPPYHRFMSNSEMGQHGGLLPSQARKIRADYEQEHRDFTDDMLSTMYGMATELVVV